MDFGRFCTGFLVVMGVGMASLSARRLLRLLFSLLKATCATYGYADIWWFSSSSGLTRPLRLDRCPSYGYVDNRRTVDLWDYHKLHDVLSGGAGFLGGLWDVWIQSGRRIGGTMGSYTGSRAKHPAGAISSTSDADSLTRNT